MRVAGLVSADNRSSSLTTNLSSASPDVLLPSVHNRPNFSVQQSAERTAEILRVPEQNLQLVFIGRSAIDHRNLNSCLESFMTFKITQYAWFLWYDAEENDVFDDRAILFQATADGNETATHVTLHGATYDIEVEGVDLAVLSGQLSDGTAHTITIFDAATDTKLVEFSGMNLDVAGFLYDYENDVTYPHDPDAPPPPGMIFDASRVAAQPDGSGIGVFGTNDGDDTMYGSQGSDELRGFAGADRILGNAGNDLLFGYEGRDTILGGAGNDTLVGFMGSDSLMGDGGADLLSGWDGRDTANGGGGNDFVYGGAGNDKLLGGKGNDFLIGDAGHDTIDGGEGRDWITASLQTSTSEEFHINLKDGLLDGHALGLDRFTRIENAYGSNGKDWILGTDGANALVGAGSRDTVNGGAGNDTLWGGSGNDTLIGGSGRDRFVFWEYSGTHADKIEDFEHGNDRIVLDHDPFFALAVGNVDASNFVLGKYAKDANDHLIYDRESGKLYYDADGLGGASRSLVATFLNKPVLTASDFKITAALDFDSFWIV
jgi:Ca2+-binding RTX toxin-like protein